MPRQRSLASRILAVTSVFSLLASSFPNAALAVVVKAPLSASTGLPAGSEVIHIGLPDLAVAAGQPVHMAPSLQAALAQMNAAALPQAPEPHKVEAFLESLKAQGISLPLSYEGPKDVRRLQEAAQRLPESPVKSELIAFVNAMALPEVSVAPAIAGVYDSSVIKAPRAMPEVYAAAPGTFWSRLSESRYVPNFLRRHLTPEPQAPATPPSPLDPGGFRVPTEKMRWRPPTENLQATRDIPGVEKQIVGQDEALAALDFGLRMPMKSRDFNVFVAGPDGSGRETAIRLKLDALAPAMPTPPDSVTLTNPADRDEPTQLFVPSGSGPSLQAGLQKLVKTLKIAMPNFLGSKEFTAKKQELHDQWSQEAKASVNKALAEVQPQIDALTDGRYGVEVHADVEEGSLRWNLTYQDTEGGPRKSYTEEELAAKGKDGSLDLREWSVKFDEMKAKLAPILKKVVPTMEEASEKHAAVHQEMNGMDRMAAGVLVNQLGAPLEALVSPQASHDDAAHKAAETRQKERLAALDSEKGKVQAGRYEVVIVAVETEAGKVPTPVIKLDGKEVSTAEIEAQATTRETRQEYRALLKAKETAHKAYLVGLKEANGKFKEEHQALHANDPKPSADALKGVAAIQAILEAMTEDYDDFLPIRLPQGIDPMMAMLARQQKTDPAEKYKLNVLATNKPGAGAPVRYAKGATFDDFIGSVDDKTSVSMMGGMAMKHKEPGGPTLIGGLVHEAHGGFLVVDVMDLIRVPGLYENVMRMLRSGQAEIPEEGFLSMIRQHGSSYKAPLPMGIKLVLVGSPWIRMLLEHYDEEFAQYFKSKVSFQSSLEITVDVLGGYLQFIKKMILQAGADGMDLSKDAVGAVLEYAAEILGSNEKLSASFGKINDYIRQTWYWARENGRKEATGEDAKKARDTMRERDGYLKKRTHEAYIKGIYHVETEGSQPERINGMAVMADFGVPTVGTLRLSVGKPGIISVDEEIHTAGPIYIRAVKEAENYLMGTYAADKRVATKITVAEEQSYGGIDGDSGTLKKMVLAELSLAGIEIRQDTFITGSADQHGKAQAIGGVNEKISGVYDVVKGKRALTKDKPMRFIIPFDNLAELALREDIIQAAEQGTVEIYAVTHTRQAEELMAKGSVSYAEINRLANERLKKDFAIAAKGPKAGE